MEDWVRIAKRISKQQIHRRTERQPRKQSMSTENTTTIEQPAPAAVRSSDGLAVWRWAVIENIVTMICTLLGCWLVSGWFALLLLMLNINYRKKSEDR